MSNLKKALIILYAVTCICYVGFGIYQIIIFGISSGQELFTRISPIIMGSSTAYIIYDRFYKPKKD